MKKLFLLNFVFTVGLLFSQGGKVIDQLSLKSEILGSERKYAIYLPSDYDYSNREYPVLYLLHGAGDDHTGWVQFGEVKSITDKANKSLMVIFIKTGHITIIIINAVNKVFGN